MLRFPAGEGTFQTIGTFTSPSGRFGVEAEFTLNFPADLIIVSVVYGIDKPWVKAGRVFQAWELPDKYVFSRNNWINLNTPTLIEVEPVPVSLIRYEPPSYFEQYTITLEAREYVNPLAPLYV